AAVCGWRRGRWLAAAPRSTSSATSCARRIACEGAAPAEGRRVYHFLTLFIMDVAFLIPVTNLHIHRFPAQHSVHRRSHVAVDGQPLPLLNLNQNVKRWRSAPLQHCLLRATAAGLFV